MVLDRKVETGQTVAASFQTPVLFKLATDLKRMQLEVDIDEADTSDRFTKAPPPPSRWMRFRSAVSTPR